MIPEPVLKWTPQQPWVMAEVARRSLVASLDGGSATFARDGSAFTIHLVEVSEGVVELEIAVDATAVVFAFAPQRPAGHRWRDGWELVIEQAGEPRIVLTPGASAVVADARRGALVGKLQQRRRAVLDPGGPVPLADVSFHHYTRQSSIVADEPPGDIYPFALPTLPERAPWWELDLGKPMAIAWARIDLAADPRTVPPTTRVRVHAFGYMTPASEPPASACILETQVQSLGRDGDYAWLEIDEPVVARFLRIELVANGAPVALAVASAEVQAAELYADTLRESLRRAFVVHADRPLSLVRSGDRYVPALRYRDVANHARAFAIGLARRLESAIASQRIVVGVMLRNCVEWIVADLAILDRGYVSVALAPDDPDERLGIILGKAKPTCVVCEPDDVERVRRLAPPGLALVVACEVGRSLASPAGDPDAMATLLEEGRAGAAPPLAPRGEDDIYAVLFTSGSTGTPKGAMRTYRTFLAMIASYALGHSPRHLSFQPLSHLSERMYLPALLANGGALGFSESGAALLDELRALAPTTIGSVPRLYEVLYAKYQRRVREDATAEPAALAEARAAFGGNILAISVGSAPVPPDVYAFMKRCFADIWVSEGYGSTEVGSITYDGKIADHVDVKLVPGPDRGEIFVKTPHQIAGYLGDAEATAAAIDDDGYFATGDLGERDGEGRIRVVGRLRNTVKLAQGEFVSAERIEAVLATAPVVDRVFAHVQSGAAGVSALVMPRADTLAALLDVPASTPLATLLSHREATRVVRSALVAHGRTHGLAAYETPRGVLLDAAITEETGLVTTNGKLARGTIAQRFGAALAALVTGDGGDQAGDDGETEVVRRVVRVARSVLRRSIGASEPLGAGVDSLAAAEILAALSDELGRDVPLAWWFEARTLDELARRLESQQSDTRSLADIARTDLALAVRVEPRAAQMAVDAPILVTGATGFLGAHLVEALRARGRDVICLVRAPDKRAACDKLAAALASRRIPITVDDHVRAVPGDLAAPELGLSPASRAELEAIGAIVHAGATVSWLASYEALRAPNVTGTLALLELAAGRPFHHVSTISTTYPTGDETTTLAFDHAIAAGPYGLSKWLAEMHVARAGRDAGVPVAIYRPAMIAGHTERGVGNTDDYLCRYMAGCAELGCYIDRDDAIIDMTPVDFVAAAIAGLLDAPAALRPETMTTPTETYHLVNVDQSLSYGALGRAMVKAGVALEPVTYDAFRAALRAHPESRLHALLAFFPEQFALGMGPWPHARTRSALDALGIVRPRIDDAIVARYVANQRVMASSGRP